MIHLSKRARIVTSVPFRIATVMYLLFFSWLLVSPWATPFHSQAFKMIFIIDMLIGIFSMLIGIYHQIRLDRLQKQARALEGGEE